MKNIIKAFLFILIFMVIFLILNLLFLPKNINLSDRKKNEFANGILREKDNTVDVLFVGDSLVYSGISPLNIWNDYGYSSYNISLVGQKIYQAWENLAISLNYQQPKILFLDASILSYSFNFSKVVESEIIYSFDLLKYHDIWKDIFGESKKVLRSLGNISNKGYKYSNVVDPFNGKRNDKNFEIDNFNKFIFNRIVKLSSDNDIKLVLINVPTMKNWNEECSVVVKEFLKKYRLEYYDLNELDMIDWSNETRDNGEHLNYYGAKKVSKYLGEYIKDTGLVEDHRGDKKYASWQEAYDKSSDKLN